MNRPNIPETQYQDFLTSRHAQGGLRDLTPLSPIPYEAGKVRIGAEPQTLRNFASNDYLGLSRDSRIIERGCEFARKYGAGSGASRLVSGNLAIYEEIERDLAYLKQREAALIFSSGYIAESGVIAALLSREIFDREPLVFFDKLNHAGMYFGASASGVVPIRFRHQDVSHLQSLLQKYDDGSRPVFVITESVFSMDGDITPLAALCTVAKQHHAFVIADDAHATGVLGENGAGLACALPKIDLIIGTFSKAFGAAGGYVACSRLVKNYLLQKCGGFIYSTAPPPFLWGAIAESLAIIQSEEGENLRKITARKAEDFRTALQNLGGDCGASATQIIPLMIKNIETGLRICEALTQNGVFAKLIRPPTVPTGGSRIRFSVNPSVREEDIGAVIDTLKRFDLINQ